MRRAFSLAKGLTFNWVYPNDYGMVFLDGLKGWKACFFTNVSLIAIT